MQTQALFVIFCLIVINHVLSQEVNLRKETVMKRENKQGKVGSLTLCFWPFYIGCDEPCDPTPSPTAQPISNPTIKPTTVPTANPTAKSSAKPTANPTDCSVESPTLKPTSKPTAKPTANPTANPTVVPTANPTAKPTVKPTAIPTGCPVESPTVKPTSKPTASPTANPTVKPTANPTANPTASPTAKPTANPTANPTVVPTANPTAKPTVKPTAIPTGCPVESPTVKPTINPTANPTAGPTVKPSATPTANPTVKPTATPTANPTAGPTVQPSAIPTANPTANPTAKPSANPIANPTGCPVESPTLKPSNYPTIQPSGSPVANPTVQPTPAPSTVQSNTPSALPSKIPSSIPTLSPSAKVTNAPSYMDGCDGSPTASPTYKPCPVSNNTINFHITLSLSNYSGSCFSQEEILAVLLDLSFASKLHPCFFSYYNTPSNSLPATVLSYHSLRGSASLNNRKAQYSLTFAVSIPLVEEYAAYESNPTALFNNITAVLSESQSNKHLTQWLRVPENTVQKGAGDLQFTEIVSISFSGSSTTVQSQGAPSSSNKSIWSLYFNYFLVAIIICGLLLIAFLAAFLYSRYRTHHRSQKFPELQKLHAVEEKLPPSSAPLQICSRNSLNSFRSAEVKYPSVYSQGDESMPSYDLENDFIAVTLLYENEEKTSL